MAGAQTTGEQTAGEQARRARATGARASVVHVITRLELGGAQQNTLYTCEHLDRERFDVHLVYGPGGMLDDDARLIGGLGLHELPFMRREISVVPDALAVAEVYVALNEIRERSKLPLIVHTHSSKAGIVGRAAAKLARADAIVHSIHGFGFGATSNPLMQRVLVEAERRASRVTDWFISVARTDLEEGVRLGLVTREHSSVIRSGIKLDAFDLPARRASAIRREVRDELCLRESAPLVLTVANFKPQKDPLTFVATCARIAKEIPDAVFLYAGDGEMRGEVEAMVARKGLSGRVLLLGWRRDVARLLAACDVFLLTSRWEGLPRAVVQAMAAGKPVVATRVNGTPEAVVDGLNGYLAAAGDDKTLAERCVTLLRSASQRRAFGEAGRARVGEWDIDEMVRAQERLYELLLTRAGVRHQG